MGALEYIRVRGLPGSDLEAFQGIGGGLSSPSTSDGGEDGDATFLTETLSDEWRTWLDALKDYLEQFEGWGDSFVSAFESNIDDDEMLNLPVPIPPTLPAPPGVGGPLSAIIAVIVFVVKWAAAHRDLIINILKILQVLEKLRKVIRSDGSIEETFKKAFLFEQDGDKEKSILGNSLLFSDPNDGRLRSILERGILITLTDNEGHQQVKSLIDLRLRDLLYHSVNCDVDGIRVDANSKIIDYK